MRTSVPMAILLALASTSGLALESECEAILKASEARMKQASWHSITELEGGMKMEVIKSDGTFYRNVGDQWVVFPVNIDDAERELMAQIRSGEIKLTECKTIGSDVVDGVPVTIVSTRTEMPGAPAGTGQLSIGKADGLPYRQTADHLTVVYKYKGVTAPKL
jgi:hypothetical protein